MGKAFVCDPPIFSARGVPFLPPDVFFPPHLAIDLIPDTMLMQRQVLLDAISDCACFQGNHIHVYLKITWHKGLDN